MTYDPGERGRDAMRDPFPRKEIYIAVGLYVDQTAADDIASVEGDLLGLSQTAQVVDATYNLDGLAVFEGYGIPTQEGSAVVVPSTASGGSVEQGVWSAGISDGDGRIDWTLTVRLSSVHESGLTVYTDSVPVYAADVTFLAEGLVTASGPLDCGQRSMVWLGMATYDEIRVHVTELSQPYYHVRVSEIEFGASRTYDPSTLAGEVTVICETDPTGLSLPLSELDFTVPNADGTWDVDNPERWYEALAEGNPVTAGITADGVTVPLGRYIVTAKRSRENLLTVTCLDPRATLQDIWEDWSVEEGESVGGAVLAMLSDHRIPAVLTSDALSVHADRDGTVAGGTLFDVLLYVAQRYDVWACPAREGGIRITLGPPTGDYGTMPVELMETAPSPVDTGRSYNVIAVAHPGGTYVLDLRRTGSGPMIRATVDNPLVGSAAEAEAVARRMASRLRTDAVSVDWWTDCLPDPGDAAALPGRFSGDDPETYTVTKTVTTYNGGTKGTLEAMK